MLSKTTKNCWRGSKYSSLITRPRFKAESMTCFMQRFAIFNRFNLSTFHWASLFDSDGADELKVRAWSFPKLSSVSSSSTPAAAILFPRYIRVVWRHIIGTFRSDYDYEYEFFNVYPVRMPDCVRLSRQLVLSSKSRRRLDVNYEIFNKSRPPTTSSLQVQRRAKSLVFKGADTLWNDPCNLSRNVLTTLWHLVLFVY